MTPLIDRMERAYRIWLRRHPGVPKAVLLHPKDSEALDEEYRFLTPACSPSRSKWMRAPIAFGRMEKWFKGLPVWADDRVPRGCVALMKPGTPTYD